MLLLIASFYERKDAFDVHDSMLAVDNDTVTAKSGDYHSVLLKKACAAPYTYHWSFKIEKYDGTVDYWNNIIGVWKAGDTNEVEFPTKSYFTCGKRGAFAFVSSREQRLLTDSDHSGNALHKAYGRQCKEGDVIGMHLDLKQLTLSYSINGEDQGVAYEVDNSKYRAAVMICGNGNQIRLM